MKKYCILILLLMAGCNQSPKPKLSPPHVTTMQQEVQHFVNIMPPEIPPNSNLILPPGTNHIYQTNIYIKWTFIYVENDPYYTPSNIVFLVRSNNNPRIDRHLWPVVAVTKALSYTQYNTGKDDGFHGYVITSSNTLYKIECPFQ